MRKINLLYIRFHDALRSNELEMFRGAVLSKLSGDSTLFHNHVGENFRYSYPLIQYKRLFGKAAIILPHGVLFRGNAEADIRKKIIDRGYIKGIIGLPANLFYGTGIPACILVLDKEDAGRMATRIACGNRIFTRS